MQLFGLFICTQSALRVSDDIFALLPAGVMDEMEREFHLVHDTGRQQRTRTWSVSEAVNKVKCT
jgi:hypothetical protein